LERGELDKLLERARRVPSSWHDDDDDERYRHGGVRPRRHDDDDDDDDERYRHGGVRPRRRKSFLENLFDF
jgi:Zn-finger nucleic acid-binding protein